MIMITSLTMIGTSDFIEPLRKWRFPSSHGIEDIKISSFIMQHIFKKL